MTGPVLLLGGSGQLGSAFKRLIPDATAPPRRDLDLATATADDVNRLIESAEASAIVNCAAFTGVDAAETETETAMRVNGASVGILATAAAQFGIPFVTFSSDYVFDGRGHEPYVESSPTAPINAYGRSKLLGESLALETNPRTLVIRTSWVISGDHPNFLSTMLGFARAGRAVQVVNDQFGCPTIADDLAAASLRAIERSVDGLLHLANQGATTWFALAQTAVSEGGLDSELIAPCTTAEYPTPARRPAYSVLTSERAAPLGLDPLPAWTDSIGRLVAAQLER